jgi:hypothetical protein
MNEQPLAEIGRHLDQELAEAERLEMEVRQIQHKLDLASMPLETLTVPRTDMNPGPHYPGLG